jgi:hypothetical protein
MQFPDRHAWNRRKHSQIYKIVSQKKANAFEAEKLIENIISTKHAYGCIENFFSVAIDLNKTHASCSTTKLYSVSWYICILSLICIWKAHTNWAGVEENMVRYNGNDDPTDAEGFNGLRTKDKKPIWAHKKHTYQTRGIIEQTLSRF